ncbi:hypothetical protein WR25_05687 [Diploscapter pachys]|uniref:Uncharacterized protein n=1 Tax=Diploscapter pachys TaxID=2018661 RepID=A0A2A2K2P8_9BILA|nr:hypothetical protein WR25_05687 [Diploscapter pachys]
MKLKVGAGQIRIAFHESARFGDVGGQHAAALAHPGIQILADPHEVVDDGNAVARQFGRGADAGRHQQLRGAECSRGENDLLPRGKSMLRAAAPIADAGRAQAVEGDAGAECIGNDD